MTDNSEHKDSNDQVRRTSKDVSRPLPTKLELESLNTDEQTFLKTNSELATDILTSLGIEKTGHRFLPSRLAKAINSWFDEDLTIRFNNLDINTYSDILAVAWGQYLEDALGMKWHVITDEFGTEIGLHHTSNNLTLFPFTSFKKCFQNQDSDLIVSITEKAWSVISETN
jgi:hypothetical protein